MRHLSLWRKLNATSHLAEEDAACLAGLCADITSTRRHADIIAQGDRPQAIHLLIHGWAARYRLLPDGSRQITAFLIPGDFCDLHVTVLDRMDHGIVALTDCDYACIPSDALDACAAERPSLARAFWRATLVDEAILREWVVNVGRRDATQAVAHLLCELHLRARMAGLAHGDVFDLPVTQDDLADATGMTPVHMNRTLQKLRGDGLIELAHRQLTVLDLAGLRAQAGFDPAYLHLRDRADAGTTGRRSEGRLPATADR
ncbi:Crp/Fnr family transcriptional regulator [Sphingomonas sp. VNH70]|uniref:Crp/Fnr family transcriptional regulator n=1 Tax=Sphingomonas silueang TaxID=3156617 RepID=UPI0032B5E639